MSNSNSRDLFDLIQSLSQAEKRAFRLYAQRSHETPDLLYLKLFDLFDKQRELDEQAIRNKMPHLTPSRFSNLKRHLYKQILITLRLLHKKKNPNIQIREQIDFAYTLYGKGLYLQALKVLEKARKQAKKLHADFSLITIIEIEKMIHSRHITRTSSGLYQQIEDASRTSETIHNRIILSNLRMRLHQFYIEQGHSKNAEEYARVKRMFQEVLPQFSIDQLGMMERVYYYQSFVWYYYIQNDFEKCREYAEKWVYLFKAWPELQDRDLNLFLRGYHYLLTATYNLRETEVYRKYLAELENYRDTKYPTFNKLSQILSFLYVHNARMNLHFLEGTYPEGVKGIPRTLKRIKRYRKMLDEHRIMVLYFKIAWMYMGNRMPEKAVDYLLHIINMRSKALREDIQSYSRLMFLMAQYDLSNFDLLPSLIRQYERYFKKVQDRNEVQLCILALFREVAKTPLLEHKEVLTKYYEQLSLMQSGQFEKRSFLYLDILPWLEERKV